MIRLLLMFFVLSQIVKFVIHSAIQDDISGLYISIIIVYVLFVRLFPLYRQQQLSSDDE